MLAMANVFCRNTIARLSDVAASRRSVIKEFGACMFGEDLYALGVRVDELCTVVRAEGLLCSTPLAGVNVPNVHSGEWNVDICLDEEGQVTIACTGTYGALGWIRKWDSITPNLDFWAINMCT